ncbi:hypothetical protein PG990_002842 [Apiospora arundinis]|jgi:hypothetical protein|uniref:Proteinase inhibitor, propeptide n=1 Tax=Apiospora arundinis TaxID=335852 RepID=A0ABR2II57_9PEZI
MRFFASVVAALAVAQGAVAVDVQKGIIVTFPQETAEDVMTRAKDEITNAGGVITHSYTLFKGFAAKAPQKIIESVHAWSTEFNAVIEEDQEVKISNNL